MAEQNKHQFFYEQTRKQIEHEDVLLNHRSTWLLVLQGFLFTAYGYSINAQATACQNASCELSKSKIIDDLRHVLSVIGISSSFFILFAVIAAATSILKLVDDWKKYNVDNKLDDEGLSYPQIIGDNPGLGMKAGLTPTLTLPLILLGAWLFILPTIFKGPIIIIFSVFSANLIKKSEFIYKVGLLKRPNYFRSVNKF